MAQKEKETNNTISIKDDQWLKVTELYLDEWKHRDGVYHKFATTFYFCSIVVSLFPYVKFVEGTISLNRIWFAVVGTLIALLTSLTIFGMSLRNGKVYDRYDELLGKMNSGFKHIYSYKKIKISKVLPWIILAMIFLMNVILVLSSYV